MSELKPCHHCGSPCLRTPEPLKKDLTATTCEACGAHGPWADTVAQAEIAWNTRAGYAPITPEMLKEMLVEPQFYKQMYSNGNVHYYHDGRLIGLHYYPASQAWKVNDEFIPGPRTRAQLENLLQCLGLSENRTKEASTTKPPQG